MNKDPFKEYIKESEPDKRDKGYAWHTAIGLQAVDGLKTSEYLELFLRNLLLNEQHPLHNRTLHVSGAFKKEAKPDIDEIKPDIDKVFRPKTVNHILMLREAFPRQTIFGRSDVMDVMDVIDIKPSRASELLKEMVEQKVIEPVSGHGKGKYRFRKYKG